MVERTLFERLASSRPGRLTARHDTQGAIDSVVRNLRVMLNARQGCSAARPDYGMPDLGDAVFSFPVSIPEVTRVIKTLVEQFEPRLRNVQVRHNNDAENIATVRFHIRAELDSGDDKMPLVLDGSLAGDGYIEVRS